MTEPTRPTPPWVLTCRSTNRLPGLFACSRTAPPTGWVALPKPSGSAPGTTFQLKFDRPSGRQPGMEELLEAIEWVRDLSKDQCCYEASWMDLPLLLRAATPGDALAALSKQDHLAWTLALCRACARAGPEPVEDGRVEGDLPFLVLACHDAALRARDLGRQSLEFHAKYWGPGARQCSLGQRYGRVRDELEELAVEVGKLPHDRVHASPLDALRDLGPEPAARVVHEAMDVAYAALALVASLGVDPAEAWAHVHAANVSKDPPSATHPAHLRKPLGWRGPGASILALCRRLAGGRRG